MCELTGWRSRRTAEPRDAAAGAARRLTLQCRSRREMEFGGVACRPWRWTWQTCRLRSSMLRASFRADIPARDNSRQDRSARRRRTAATGCPSSGNIPAIAFLRGSGSRRPIWRVFTVARPPPDHTEFLAKTIIPYNGFGSKANRGIHPQDVQQLCLRRPELATSRGRLRKKCEMV